MSEATMEKILDELKKIEKTMATKEELASLAETIAILSNPNTMKQIKDNEKDISEGKVRTVRSVNDMLDDS